MANLPAPPRFDPSRGLAPARHAGPPRSSTASGPWRPDVLRWLQAHQNDGHRCADLDPLGVADSVDARELLAPGRFGLDPTERLGADAPALLGAHDVAGLDRALKRIYCGRLALDTSAVRDADRRHWLHAHFETLPPPHRDQALLDRLIQAEVWERHVARRFPLAKRFSLEGCEALLPLMDALAAQAALHAVAEVFIGMPHRGRVNLLVNLFGMPPAQVLDHIDPATTTPLASDDLIYHLGARRLVHTEHGPVTLQLAPNPSHLQSIHPVVLGMTYAAQKQCRAAALVLHGDAAFAGQGVVMEALMLSQRSGYAVGGCIHVILNNQLGFTTPNPMDAAASRYCTDVARCIDAPVLRVNAEAPEQLARAAALAFAYRARFGADVLIDLIGYRRLGHAEQEEPALSSPGLYPMAARRPPVATLLGEAMVADGLCSASEMAEHLDSRRAAVDHGLLLSAQAGAAAAHRRVTAQPQRPADSHAATFELDTLGAWVSDMTRLPRGFQPHPVIARLVDQWRRSVADTAARVNWCFAENMAYASLLTRGIAVRVSGMDVERGTFLHRQAVWHNQTPTGPDKFVPLRQLSSAAGFEVVNSPLSEEAVLGFEYGHSVQRPDDLTIWEAQYGDFVNGAQVFIDQYIASGEEKWGQRSALVLLLPHGHEGVGPEHSNAFLGRFLQLCGAGNLRVAYPSTAAQWFHLLRRQALDPVRKPLIVMSPKAVMQQDADSHSPVQALLQGGFEPLLDDRGVAADAVERVVLCSGKLHHELARARAADPQAASRVALLRIEQLYPFPAAELAATLSRYRRAETLVWAQEEALNQGAWHHVRDELAPLAPPGRAWQPVARAVTASGATASVTLHRRQQAELLSRALNG